MGLTGGLLAPIKSQLQKVTYCFLSFFAKKFGRFIYFAIGSLAIDFPKLWNNPKTLDREKKRMVRLLLEDVTLTRDKIISVGIRFKGGATKVLTLPIPLSAFMSRKTRPEVVEEVDRLLEHHHNIEIANVLNDQGHQTGNSHPFTAISVRRLRRDHHLKDRYTRLREKGMLNRKEITKYLKTNPRTLKSWKDNGWIKIHAYGNIPQTILYEPPGDDFYAKMGEPFLAPLNKGLHKYAQKVVGGAV